MMSIIENVVFDIGNVLLRWDPRNLYRRLGYSDAATAQIMAETGLPEINHRVLDAGASFAPTIEVLAARFPQHASFLRAFDACWLDTLDGPIANNVAIFEALRRHSVPVFALSNYNREKFDQARALFPFLNSFDGMVISGDVGLVKPDAPIFELLIRRYALRPDRTVFIDDSEPNTKAAEQLGIRAIHFTEGKTRLAAELSRLGLSKPLLR
jgi:HAD superfamily hydrolase (TIGR01509 family)